MTDRPPASSRRIGAAVARLCGGVLIASGAMMALLSGLCSLYFIGHQIFGLATGRSDVGGLLGVALAATVFGCAPFMVGIALFAWGRIIWGEATARPSDEGAEP